MLFFTPRRGGVCDEFLHFVALPFAADDEFGVWEPFDDGGHAFDEGEEAFACIEATDRDYGDVVRVKAQFRFDFAFVSCGLELLDVNAVVDDFDFVCRNLVVICQFPFCEFADGYDFAGSMNHAFLKEPQHPVEADKDFFVGV